MDNFMFQKLMNAQKEEEHKQEQNQEEIEVLEENNENQERKQEEDKEGYVARKNQNYEELWISISKEIIKEVFIKIVMVTI